MKKCYIVGAGDMTKTTINIPQGSFVISADGGYEHLKKANILPDIAMGDFDSLGFVPEDVQTIVFPCEKDYPDMMLAVDEAVKRGYDDIVIYGALGGRMDHTLGNLQMLSYFSQKEIKIALEDDSTLITAISDTEMEFEPRDKGLISVFAFGGMAWGVTIKGLKYTLDDATLDASIPIGVSNEFIGEKAKISVENGTLILIVEK